MSNDYTITIDTSSNISTHTSPSTVTISGIDYDQGSLITDTGSEYINNITYSTSSSSLNTVTLDDTHWGDSVRWEQTEFVDTMPNLEKIEDMCKEYFESIIWCAKYYIDKCYNWKWYYKYSVGPSFYNLNKYIYLDYLKEDNKSYQSYEQLMIILPPKSYNLIKNKYEKILTDKYKHLSPLEFNESHILKRYLWESEPIIPDFNLNLT